MDVEESNRLKGFRQLRKEIRSSKEHLIVGIDVGKDKHHAFFGMATGKTLLRRLIFENSIDGFEKLFAYAEAIKVQHALDKVVFGLEPTANYHKPLAEYLIKCDHSVVLVSGVAVSKNRELLDGRWDKNDDKDSANVADLISQGKCLYYDYPSMPIRDLRSLLSLKRRFKKQEHGTKVRIRNHLLAQYFPEFDRYFGKGSSESLSVVKWCLKPSKIAGMEYDEFVHLVAPRVKTIGQEKRLKKIWDLAIGSIGCEAGDALDFEAKLMVEDLQQIKDSTRAIDDHIKEICLGFPEYSYLLTIPGFGPDVSSKVLGAIGNPFRFDNGKQVLKLLGYDLGAYRSGKTSDSAVPVISKRGKAYLRYALYQAAFIASTSNRHFIIYYTNKLRGREREKGIKTKMKVKLAAKMLI
ncbi:MAG: IS110 family transposase, partial [Deltaproteobacteria bacterium]|nr:IS110 family transposase [Deltaproteobacteria bacterium]